MIILAVFKVFAKESGMAESAQDTVRCSLCENGVEYFCILCHVKLCNNCISKHLADKNRKHEIENFISKRKSLKNYACSSHEKNICKIYCRDCEIPICAKCAVGVHRQHDFIEFEEFLEEKKNKHLTDLKRIEWLLLFKIQKQTDDKDETEYENAIKRISEREEEICSAVRNFGSKLREKLTKHKKDNEEKANQNKFAEENILRSIQEAKSLLTKDDSKRILLYSGIKPALMDSPQELNTCVPILDTKSLLEEDIASVLGQLKFKPVDRKDKDLDRVGKVEDEPWFHGSIPQEEAERLLMKDGDFLVRESERSTEHDRCFVISTFRQGSMHFDIMHKHLNEKLGTNATVVDFINFLKVSGEKLSVSNPSVLLNPVDRDKSQLDYDDIVLDSTLGEKQSHHSRMLFQGSYGSRTVYIQKSENGKNVFKNLTFMRQFKHPNIIRLIGYSALHRPVLLVMEYLSGGSLLSYLRQNGSSISKKKRVEMCEDVASGMAYLHLNKCIHRDLATRNCSVGDKTTVKISDFWMAELGEKYEIPENIKIEMPIKWTAPEFLQYENYTFFSDVWSFGILMWEIFSSGELPYTDLKNEETRAKVISGYKMPAPDGTPKGCYDLMLQCWEFTPAKRYLFKELVEKLQEIVTQLQDI